jgi:hypothetical protein
MTQDDNHVLEEIHIEATPQQVWDVLFDFDTLAEWSNGFLGTDKQMVEGEISTAYFRNPASHGRIAFTHTVVVYEPGRKFGWSGELGHGHHDHHIYEMEAHPEGGTLFRQKDGVYGKPSSILTRMMEHGIDHSYKSFNKKLKKRVESILAK